MKWIASLLAMLVLTLSVQPACATLRVAAQVDACCAEDGCTDEESRESSDEKSDDCHGCNPFESSCACCAAAVIIPTESLTFQAPSLPAAQPVWSAAAPQFPAAVYGDFWQPPKIG